MIVTHIISLTRNTSPSFEGCSHGGDVILCPTQSVVILNINYITLQQKRTRILNPTCAFSKYQNSDKLFSPKKKKKKRLDFYVLSLFMINLS